MHPGMLRRSAETLRPYFAELAEAGAASVGMNRLRAIGLKAEAAMLSATEGVNTHRGAVFGLGLLCAAAGATGYLTDSTLRAPRSLGAAVAERWGYDILRGPVDALSHGSVARRRYGAGGARAEAAAGFPSLYEIALPALRAAQRLAPHDEQASRVQACFALIAAVCDTNLLYRGGAEGAHYARQAAAFFISEGGVARPDWRARAAEVHAAFVARGLSPGGCADLLAMTLFVDALEIGD
jgi:triphosphoribosyl-dephospho-CoA synthase